MGGANLMCKPLCICNHLPRGYRPQAYALQNPLVCVHRSSCEDAAGVRSIIVHHLCGL